MHDQPKQAIDNTSAKLQNGDEVPDVGGTGSPATTIMSLPPIDTQAAGGSVLATPSSAETQFRQQLEGKTNENENENENENDNNAAYSNSKSTSPAVVDIENHPSFLTSAESVRIEVSEGGRGGGEDDAEAEDEHAQIDDPAEQAKDTDPSSVQAAEKAVNKQSTPPAAAKDKERGHHHQPMSAHRKSHTNLKPGHQG